MDRPYLTTGIRDIIVANAYTIAHKIITTSYLPSYHIEDLMQQLIIAGLRFEQEYRDGANSINTYITGRMLDFGKNIVRDTQTAKRKVQFFVCEVEEEKLTNENPNLKNKHDIVTIVDVRDKVSRLKGDELLFVSVLMENSLFDTRKILAWTRTKFERIHVEIKKKFKN